jgi:hypothetical protein
MRSERIFSNGGFLGGALNGTIMSAIASNAEAGSQGAVNKWKSVGLQMGLPTRVSSTGTSACKTEGPGVKKITNMAAVEAMILWQVVVIGVSLARIIQKG